jgi:protein-L-isoaspartate(D-aspartate) O-methyltransferase
VTSTTTFSVRVQAALDAVDEAAYTTQPDGSRIRQSSAPLIIATMLDLLDVQAGQRVLEIGTGSGYSTALLTALTGKDGHVTSVDIDPDLIVRARQLLAADGRHNTHLIIGDGRKGAPECCEHFDRIVAWATVERIPADWVAQAVHGAIIVAPVSLTDLAKTYAVVRARYDDAVPGLVGETITPGGFVEAHDEVLDQWLVPPRGVDALVHDDEGRPWWLSADWLRAKGQEQSGRLVLDQLMNNTDTTSGPLVTGEDGAAFHAYLLATRPEGLTTASLGSPAWWLGCTIPAGAAFVSADDGRETVHGGDSEALHRLTRWAEHWRSIGRPGYSHLRPALDHDEHGWTVRATLRET